MSRRCPAPRRARHDRFHSAETPPGQGRTLHAEKHPVEKGEVRVRKEVHTETKTLEVPVERKRWLSADSGPRPIRRRGYHRRSIREGEEIRIPIREEQVNVSKHAVVTEESRSTSGRERHEESRATSARKKSKSSRRVTWTSAPAGPARSHPDRDGSAAEVRATRPHLRLAVSQEGTGRPRTIPSSSLDNRLRRSRLPCRYAG